MAQDVRALKDRAVELMGKRRFEKAAQAYEQLCALSPRDPSLRQRLGDALRAAGKKAGAIKAYRAAADRYAEDGMLLKAIALCKIVLEVEPSHTEMQASLAALYARRASSPPPKVAPVAEETSPAPLDELPPADELPPPDELQEIEPVLDLTQSADDADETIELVFPEEQPVVSARAEPAQPPAPEPASNARVFATPLFEALEPAAFVGLLQGCLRRHFQPGEVLIRQGEEAHSFFVLAEGEVRVVRDLEAAGPVARSVELAVLSDGSFFGELALLTSAPRSASVVAVTEGEALEFPSPMLEDLARVHPPVSAVLQRFARSRLLQNTMATSPLFRPFDWEHRKQLIERFKQREVPPGEVVLREGEAGDGLFVVLQGRMAVEQAGNRLAELREGDVFGEMSLLTHGKASATVSAVGPAKVLRLPREEFAELISTHPQALEAISELAEQRQQTNEALRSGAVAYDVEGLILL
jgi:CRP-like cAMP-binding protein